MAIFTDDGLMYPGEIIKVFDSNRCIVRYLHYLNEEEKYMDDLFEYEEDSIYEIEDDEPISNAKNTESSQPRTSKKLEQNLREMRLSEIDPPFPPIPPPPFLFKPDQISTSGNNSNIDENLHAMLMSWYMAGYHTGFYYGLIESEKMKKWTFMGIIFCLKVFYLE